MMKPPALSFVSLSLFITLFSSTFHFSQPATDIVQGTCKKSAAKNPNINYAFCLSSLRADNRSRTADLRKLGLISVALIRHNITGTRRDIEKLSKDKSVDPFVETRLNDCFQLYSDALPALKEAKRDYKAKQYKDANFEISSVMDSSSTCEDGFTEREGVVSPLTKQNKDIFQLAAISLSIVNMLQ